MKTGRSTLLQPEQERYLEGIEPARDALLSEMEAEAVRHGNQISDPEVASFLAVTVAVRQPKAILEVGTNIGYGAIVLARAAGAGARVVTLELGAERCEVARGYIARAGLSERIEVRQVDALEALRADTSPVDFAYLDCVKEHYAQYFDLIVPRLTPGGILVADNVLWKGLVAADTVPDAERERVEVLRRFNRNVVTDARLKGVILPLGDGVAYAVRV